MSQLPDDIMNQIVGLLPNYRDKLMVALMCKSRYELHISFVITMNHHMIPNYDPLNNYVIGIFSRNGVLMFGYLIKPKYMYLNIDECLKYERCFRRMNPGDDEIHGMIDCSESILYVFTRGTNFTVSKPVSLENDFNTKYGLIKDPLDPLFHQVEYTYGRIYKDMDPKDCDIEIINSLKIRCQVFPLVKSVCDVLFLRELLQRKDILDIMIK